jgi:hypothetical protein
MPRFTWHFDADGWPLERIETFTGEHVPVLTGVTEELLLPQDGWRPTSSYRVPVCPMTNLLE